MQQRVSVSAEMENDLQQRVRRKSSFGIWKIVLFNFELACPLECSEIWSHLDRIVDGYTLPAWNK